MLRARSSRERGRHEAYRHHVPSKVDHEDGNKENNTYRRSEKHFTVVSAAAASPAFPTKPVMSGNSRGVAYAVIVHLLDTWVTDKGKCECGYACWLVWWSRW
jgi:hypothetical protein